MKKIVFYICLLLFCASCTDSKFTVKGVVKSASGKTMYFEHVTYRNPIMLDSIVLNDRGNFKFKNKVPDYPDFYRLRIGSENIVLAVSDADNIIINADANDFETGFVVENSEETDKIRKLRLSSTEFMKKAETADSVTFYEALKKHQDLASQIIISNTHGLASYYAIHQTIKGQYLISPLIKEQLSLWAAVATGFDLYYPEYDRTKELKQITLDAMRNRRAADMLKKKEIVIDAEVVNFIDIDLPDRAGDFVSLSSLKGKCVLIDFTAYVLEYSNAHTLFLKELYEKYSSSGFEIYQISLDENKLFWMEQSRNTPWICVRDNAAPACKYIATYNVTDLPTMFLMSRNGEIVGRFSHENIEKAIKENL